MFDQVQLARERLRGYAHVTPVVTSQTLNDLVGAKVFFKCENLQRVGAFKFRGAYNAMARLGTAERARGVIAFSSGNHGQGTAALEFCEQAGPFDAILAPVGGGGLLSGTAIAAKGYDSRCRVIGVEPELANDATLSFRTKTLHTVDNPPTIADGTRTHSLGTLTFPLILEYVDDMVTVSESAIMEAVKFLFYRMKLVVEPSGALGLAALMSGAVKAQGRIGIILSGGNMDAATATAILQS